MLDIFKWMNIGKLFEFKSPWCVGLLDVKAGFEPQVIHQNEIKKYLFCDFFSADFWQNFESK